MNDYTSKIEEELHDNELKMNLRIYIRFWSYIVKQQIFIFMGYFVFLIFMASLTPVFTILWKQYIDTTSGRGELSHSLFFLFLYILVKILLDFCYFFSMKFMDTINFSSWRVLDKAINVKAASIPGEYFEIPNVQNKINRAWEFNHGSYIQLYQLGLDSIRYIAQTIGIFVALFIISPMLCGISLLTIVPTILSKIIGDKISVLTNRQLTDDENECNYYRNSIFNQSLLKDIIIKNGFDFFQKKYESKAVEIYTRRKVAEIRKMRLSFLEEAVRNMVIILCILFVSYQTVVGAVSLGGLAATFAVVINLIYTLSNLVKNVGSVFTLTYDITQFYEFMDLDCNTNGNSQKYQSAVKEEPGIEFADVSYRYPFTQNYVLRNLNISIPEGKRIAVVGANGSGKTTFVKLILKLLEPSAGEIRYKGIQINSVDCNEYWNHFSSVFQDYSKYKDSLRYNVSIASVDDRLDDAGIKKALSEAEFHKEIELDCMLSKEFGGIELSGGEWQKVALARAIFQSNSIFILDEPTSAIDPMKEAEIYKRFAEMTKGKTSIFVTHRLGSVLHSDLVLFFHDGEITEAGTHDALLLKKGQYYKFWNTQSSLYNQ